MRKSNQEITDRSVLEEILSLSKVCRIAVNDQDTPYLIPVNFGYHGNCIFIHSAKEGKKMDLLTRNTKVTFEVEHTADVIPHEKACKWAALYRSVVGHATVEIITDFEQKKEGLAIIMSHYGAPDRSEFDEKEVSSVVILKLVIESMTGKQSGNWDRIFKERDYTLSSDRLILKEVTWNDLENIHRLHSFPEVDEFNTLGIPENISDTRNVLRTSIEDKYSPVRKKFSWAVFDYQNHEFIGEAGISLSADRFRLGEIFYNLDPSFWGYGYGTEIVRRLIKFGFDDLHLHKVEAGVATENFRSVRVLEKAGMKREGLRRKILPVRGEWKDNYHYAIVEGDDLL